MAVPALGNGEEEEEIEPLFEEVEGGGGGGRGEGEEWGGGGRGEGEEWADLDHSDVPPHLRGLVDAANRGDLAALRTELDNHSGTIDDPVEDGVTVLHLCCLYGHLPCVQFLLHRGASLFSKDEEGALPLHYACVGGFTEIVRVIINSTHNADFVKQMLDTTDAEGDTPLHHAARGKHLDVVNLLLSAGASPETINIYEKTPAELAEPNTVVGRALEAAASSITASGK